MMACIIYCDTVERTDYYNRDVSQDKNPVQIHTYIMSA